MLSEERLPSTPRPKRGKTAPKKPALPVAKSYAERILQTLAKNSGMSAADLANAFGTKRGNLKGALARLVRDGKIKNKSSCPSRTAYYL
jgi:predicted transcriptional regulator